MKNTNPQPQLLAPGAPLPLIQRLLIRYILGPLKAKKADWQSSRVHFENVSDKVLHLIEKVPKSFWDYKILVPPQRGLEDSSRYWSINETLEHMTIVGMAVSQIMVDLGENKEASLIVSTAAAKPKGDLNAEKALRDFTQFVQSVKTELDSKIKNRSSQKTCLHPWFGPFAIKEWNWLLGVHQSIHYLQLKKIIEGLNKMNLQKIQQ